ncbi:MULTISPECIES: hypothetical protein [Flavobacterium]|uniref:Lipoprotein n=2 Tax=Flavobacterium TaxID=237 RepID=A0A1B9DY57_9FLAO|nr:MULTISPECIES: hypothetical protein [Flavobacterium]OCB74625.1 hypothetical protein FBGL_01265 [Flavobacterium glycines]GEL09398.1 hypothetical protein FGL01_01370 [Flavobacterium glycines]CAD0004895.1 hypothetical protein FLACHUCJ7_02115 [Flavobacterium chungangense]SDJ08240.1 hypothetical protein SAMN05192550_1604 [Flavobacterium glycines]
MKIRILIVIILVFISCKKEVKEESEKVQNKGYNTLVKRETKVKNIDTIETSKKHKTNKILCDLDGDNLNEIVEIVRSTKNGKSGLRIIFGNGNRTDYFGMGNNILEQGFDEIDWAGIFEKAPKNEIYWNNVNKDGELLSEEEIKEVDKIKLLNDGIYMHAKESCGGGIIYLKNGKYEWIQQE